MTNNVDVSSMMADSKYYMGYSRFKPETNSYETWEESVKRVMDMHRDYYKEKMTPELSAYIDYAESAYRDKLVLGAQRALQFGGEQLLKHQARMYNCSVSYADRPAFFNETFYLLLCGCGVGFSVQSQHVNKLPEIKARSSKRIKLFQVDDSIEGWSDALAVLLSSFFPKEHSVFPQYSGHHVLFDFDKIRPKGSMISGGFKAPGADGLRNALVKIETLLNNVLSNKEFATLTPIVVYDIIMHVADAVLSGGVRRSATICMFDKNDTEMLNAKTGNWYIDNPQRGRSNNSVMLKRNELTRSEWSTIMNSVKNFGEPGFIFTDDLDYAYNPCVEIGMRPMTEDGRSGFQFCNLSEINGGKINSIEDYERACIAASILGTIQAGYTNFKYLSNETKEITEREALIGVSITGWMNSPKILFDADMMKFGANKVKEINKIVSKLININQAARTTCAKPAGNASVLLGTASGIHGEHSEMYFRNVQFNEQDDVLKAFIKHNPHMVEKSVWSANGTDYVVSFPITSKQDSIFKKDLVGIKQLHYVKLAQQYWVEHGTNVDLCVSPTLRHNISNTITVSEWDEVEQYLFDNRDFFAGVSLLPLSGDKIYQQAPFTEVLTAEQILKTYGEGCMFASGMIVDALHAFNNNLWDACTAVHQGTDANMSDDSKFLLKKDFIRRAKKFAKNYFNNDLEQVTNCLKDCYNRHRWLSIQRQITKIDFLSELKSPTYINVDTLGSQACAGGSCEL